MADLLGLCLQSDALAVNAAKEILVEYTATDQPANVVVKRAMEARPAGVRSYITMWHCLGEVMADCRVCDKVVRPGFDDHHDVSYHMHEKLRPDMPEPNG